MKKLTVQDKLLPYIVHFKSNNCLSSLKNGLIKLLNKHKHYKKSKNL